MYEEVTLSDRITFIKHRMKDIEHNLDRWTEVSSLSRFLNGRSIAKLKGKREGLRYALYCLEELTCARCGYDHEPNTECPPDEDEG